MDDKNYYFIKSYDENLALPPKENLGEILGEMFLHPFNWNYRTTRKSYWLGVLVRLILAIPCAVILNYGMNSSIDAGLRWIDIVVSCILYIWLFLSGLGQTIRRLHDVGYSGYWYWVLLLPPGIYFLFYLALQPSKQTAVKWNQYLFSQARPWGDYSEATDFSEVPEPSIRQIIKEHFFDCFKWNARSTRTSYWVGTAISMVIEYLFLFFSLTLVYMTTNPRFELRNVEIEFSDSLSSLLLFLMLLLSVLIAWTFLAQLGHTVRRLHDAGFSGWWYWINLIPYVGELLLSFLLFHPSTKNEIKWQGYLFKDSDLRK